MRDAVTAETAVAPILAKCRTDMEAVLQGISTEGDVGMWVDRYGLHSKQQQVFSRPGLLARPGQAWTVIGNFVCLFVCMLTPLAQHTDKIDMPYSVAM